MFVIECRSSSSLYADNSLSVAASALWRLPLVYLVLNFIRIAAIMGDLFLPHLQSALDCMSYTFLAVAATLLLLLLCHDCSVSQSLLLLLLSALCWQFLQSSCSSVQRVSYMRHIYLYVYPIYISMRITALRVHQIKVMMTDVLFGMLALTRTPSKLMHSTTRGAKDMHGPSLTA